jgi:hypothetical protein
MSRLVYTTTLCSLILCSNLSFVKCVDSNFTKRSNFERHPHRQHKNHAADKMNVVHFLDLPESITFLIINIGSNLDPPMPPENNKFIAVIAIEPISVHAHSCSRKIIYYCLRHRKFSTISNHAYIQRGIIISTVIIITLYVTIG